MAQTGEHELVETFSSITGADAATAEHVLEAHAWDLNNSVNFFLEQGAAPLPEARGLQEHPVPYLDEEDEDYDPGPAHRPVPPTRIELPDSPVPARPFAPSHRPSTAWDFVEHGDLSEAGPATKTDAGTGHQPNCIAIC